LTLPGKEGEKLWRPDTFFRNDIETKEHNQPTPNQYVRVFNNGEVLSSQRYASTLTVNMIGSMPLNLFFCCQKGGTHTNL
jgi:hypothetical protein